MCGRCGRLVSSDMEHAPIEIDEEVLEDLRTAVRGKVMVQESTRLLYSLDGSSYQVVPDVVIVPEDEVDVVRAVIIAGEEDIPITPRGCGTGLVGGSLNVGICLDMKNLNSVSVDGDSATVGSGVARGALDRVLGKHGKMLGPNPSVGGFCSIGGMLAHNSGGSRSVKYGSMVDNVARITFVDGTGRMITLPDDEDIGQDVMRIAKLIDRDKFPKVTKNASGYRLDSIGSIGETHKLLVGSEGTLGVILSADLNIVDEPKNKMLFVLGYDSSYSAMANCPKVVGTGPSACEFIDHHILSQADLGLDPGTNCILLVEYDDDLQERAAMLRSVVTGTIVAESGDQKEMDWWWDHRNAALHHSLVAVDKHKRTPHMIDDAAVPLDRMVEMLHILDGINEKYGTSIITFGHVGSGNIHARLEMDNTKTDTIRKIASAYCREINKLGGTITAEHGDGFASSEFIEMQHGSQNYNAFKAAKRYFDPYEILNPNKKITEKSTIVEHLSAVRTFHGGKMALSEEAY